MGNLLGKDCPQPPKEQRRPRPAGGVGWNPPAITDSAIKAVPDSSSLTSGGEAGRLTGGEKATLDPKDFIVSGKEKELLVREPGSIGGQQFIVEECKGCDIYLLDHSAALTIDVCTDCRLFVGPCESSLFIRDCKDCTVVVACQQFRARDCSNCTFFLFSATQPVIESSVALRFACYTLDYFSLAGQFAAAKLSVWNNKWSQIFNFTGGKEDWSCLPPASHHRNFTGTALPDGTRQRVGYTENTNGAVVPLTAGIRDMKNNEETCFVVVMPAHIDAVLGKLLAVRGSPSNKASPPATGRLLRTKLFRPQAAQSKSFFERAPTNMSVLASSSPVLGLQWAGEESVAAAMALLVAAGAATQAKPPETAIGTEITGTPISKDAIVVGAGGMRYYMPEGSAASAAKAEMFFEQWDENKGIPIGSGG